MVASYLKNFSDIINIIVCKFDRNKYYVFCSNNTAVGNNEVTITIEKDCFNIEYIKSYLS